MISLLYSLTYLFLISLALENGEKLKVFISFIRSASELPGEISGSIYTCCSPRLVNNFHHFSDGTLLRNSHRQCFKKKTSPSPADLSNRELITNSTTQKQKVGRDSSRCSFVGQRISLLITLLPSDLHVSQLLIEQTGSLELDRGIDHCFLSLLICICVGAWTITTSALLPWWGVSTTEETQ